MKLHMAISDPISGQSYHDTIIAKNWQEATDYGKQEAKKWSQAYKVDVTDVEVKLTLATPNK